MEPVAPIAADFGTVAKLVNDLLPERHVPFWREARRNDYFDGCLRDELQCRRGRHHGHLEITDLVAIETRRLLFRHRGGSLGRRIGQDGRSGQRSGAGECVTCGS